MENKDYALFKRCMDWYAADPAFRIMLHKKPEEAIRRLGFAGKVAGLKALEAIRYLIFREDPKELAEKNPYVVAFHAYQQPIIDWLKEMHSAAHMASPELYAYLQAQRERCRRESPLIRRHSLIYYFPFAIELSDGCRMQCPFCGFKAASFKENYLYTKENARLFREVLTALRHYSGDLGGCCPAYFATEPMDNPDYERFLLIYRDVFGHMPQTTTAAAELDPVRIKTFMGGIPEEALHEQALWRFSIRSLPQFKKMMAHYSPEDLLHVELLANNPESVNRYSHSGRARDAADSADQNTLYSIDCIAGLKINMVQRSMAWIEPVVPNVQYPLGYRTLERASFTDSEDFKGRLDRMMESIIRK